MTKTAINMNNHIIVVGLPIFIMSSAFSFSIFNRLNATQLNSMIRRVDHANNCHICRNAKYSKHKTQNLLKLVLMHTQTAVPKVSSKAIFKRWELHEKSEWRLSLIISMAEMQVCVKPPISRVMGTDRHFLTTRNLRLRNLHNREISLLIENCFTF